MFCLETRYLIRNAAAAAVFGATRRRSARIGRIHRIGVDQSRETQRTGVFVSKTKFNSNPIQIQLPDRDVTSSVTIKTNNNNETESRRVRQRAAATRRPVDVALIGGVVVVGGGGVAVHNTHEKVWPTHRHKRQNCNRLAPHLEK